MIESGRISLVQFTILVIFFMIGPAILLESNLLASNAKQDAWIAAIVGTIFGVIVVLLFNVLGSQFPQMTLIQCTEKVFGKWIGKTVSLLYFSFFIVFSSIILRNVGDFMTTAIMPETPIQAIHIIYMVVVIMAVRLGIEPLARAAQIFFPWVALLFIGTLICTSPQLEFQKIQPILEHGFKPIFRASIFTLTFPFTESVVLLMIFPFVNSGTKQLRKGFLLGALVGGMCLIIMTLLAILTLGADLTARNMYPSFVLAKGINIGHFLQRIEAIIAGMWFLTIFFKLTMCFYASVLGLAQILNLNGFRILTLPLGVIVIWLSIKMSPNTAYFGEVIIGKLWVPYVSTFGVLFPLIILGVGLLRKKRILE